MTSVNMRILNGQYISKQQAVDFASGPEWSFDIETFVNYFLAMFYRGADNTVVYFDTREGFDKQKLEWFTRCVKSYGFNSLSFDIPVTVAYVIGYNSDSSYAHMMAQDVISWGRVKNNPIPKKDMLAEYGLTKGWDINYLKNHYDLKGAAFGMHSLKYYAAVLGIPELQDLPYHHAKELTDEEKQEVFNYCIKDCKATYALRQALDRPIAIRNMFGEKYGTDLRSKGDAAMAESLLLRDYEFRTHKKPKRPEFEAHTKIGYKPPPFVSFQSDMLKDLRHELSNRTFDVNDGKIVAGSLKGRKITIGKGVYTVGLGGLHSCETKVTHIAADDMMLIDCDVASYYPNMLLRNGYTAPALGHTMLLTYKAFVDERMTAKEIKDDLLADGLKIPLNATFGKLKEKFATIYAPEMFLNITLTGQLLLLSLIEALELAGFEVISANTDGVIAKVLKSRYAEYNAVLADWSKRTDLKLEKTYYRAIYSKDVNDYIAIYADNSKVKTKGKYSGYGLSSLQAKAPDMQIVKDAVVNYLWKGQSIDQTINNCKDLLQFTLTANVSGKDAGIYYRSKSLGRVVRYYYSVKTSDKLLNHKGDQIPNARNVVPCMDMPEGTPKDLCRPIYVQLARGIITKDFDSPKSLDFFGNLTF